MNVIELDFNEHCSISEYVKYEEEIKPNNLMCKQTLLMNTLNIYFKDIEHLNIMIPIIVGKSSISLRVLDWFVTNYAKKNNVSYDVFDKKTNLMKKFIVHIDYKSQLKAYSKKYFDPFCRRERIIFNDQNINEQYINESIRYPALKIVKGYNNLMPKDYVDLPSKEVDALIEFIKSLK